MEDNSFPLQWQDNTCRENCTSRSTLFSTNIPFFILQEHLLKYVGGSSATKTVRRILSKTGTNALWANYSLKGQRDKKSLSGTLMYPIIKRKYFLQTKIILVHR